MISFCDGILGKINECRSFTSGMIPILTQSGCPFSTNESPTSTVGFSVRYHVFSLRLGQRKTLHQVLQCLLNYVGLQFIHYFTNFIKYFLIIAYGYDEEELLKLLNLVGVVFLLERKPEIHVFMEQMTNVLEKLPADMFPLFPTWIKIVTNRGLSDEHKRRVSEIIDHYTEPREVRTMISNLEKEFENFEFNAEQKGKIEGKSEVAKTMLEKGMDTSFIAELTGLTKEEVEKSRKLPQ